MCFYIQTIHTISIWNYWQQSFKLTLDAVVSKYIPDNFATLATCICLCLVHHLINDAGKYITELILIVFAGMY